VFLEDVEPEIDGGRDTPAVVTRPSSTTRASTMSATARSSSRALWCVVAFRPRKEPRALRMSAPVHTLAIGFSVPKSRSRFRNSGS